MERWILYFYVFVLGCVIASFINVVIYRLPLKISVIKGRSFCPYCHHQLHAFDLIPLLSYCFLKGKCRYCHQKIDIHDTLRELTGGLLALLCFYRYDMTFMTLFSFLSFMDFMVIVFIQKNMKDVHDYLMICCFLLFLYTIFLHVFLNV